MFYHKKTKEFINNMKFYTHLITPFGEFEGESLSGTPDQYDKLCEFTKHFYDQEVYHQYLNDGSFFVCGRETIKQSIIMIKVIDDDNDSSE
jgi:hypothetical protein